MQPQPQPARKYYEGVLHPQRCKFYKLVGLGGLFVGRPATCRGHMASSLSLALLPPQGSGALTQANEPPGRRYPTCQASQGDGFYLCPLHLIRSQYRRGPSRGVPSPFSWQSGWSGLIAWQRAVSYPCLSEHGMVWAALLSACLRLAAFFTCASSLPWGSFKNIEGHGH